MGSFLIIACGLALNAMLSCVEMAFVSVSKADLRRLADQKNHDAMRLLALRDNPERTLSVLQIGITLVGAVSAAVGGAGAEESLSPYLAQRFGVSEKAADIFSVAFVVLPITYLSVVVGELVPKSLALRNPLKLALWSSRWLVLFDGILSPVVWFLEKSTHFVLRVFPSAKKSQGIAAAEATVEEIEALPKLQRQYVLNLIELGRRSVGEIALPWAKVDKLQMSMTIDQVKATVLASGHTRLPVCEEDLVIGLLHTKEFTVLMDTGGTDWKALIRGALHVHSPEPIPEVLKLMQNTRNHMALVIESSGTGAPTGIVTLEGIFEEVIGDIYDEDDDGRMRRILLSNPRYLSLLGRR